MAEACAVLEPDRADGELIALLQLDEIKKAMEKQGAEAEPRTPAEFGQFIAAETVKWGKLVRNMKVRDSRRLPRKGSALALRGRNQGLFRPGML